MCKFCSILYSTFLLASLLTLTGCESEEEKKVKAADDAMKNIMIERRKRQDAKPDLEYNKYRTN